VTTDFTIADEYTVTDARPQGQVGLTKSERSVSETKYEKLSISMEIQRRPDLHIMTSVRRNTAEHDAT
jgi:hypothetical protein